MPIVLLEHKKSRTSTRSVEISSSTTELVFRLFGTNDDAVAHAYLQTAGVLPITYAGMFLQNYSLTPLAIGLLGGVWEVRVNYSPLTPKKPGEFIVEFDTMGGTQHITHSLGTVASYSWVDNQSAPDFKGAIGVNDTTVEGTDIHVGGFTWSETHWIPVALMTRAYLDILEAMTPTVNNEVWRGRAAGEVLFLGVRGSLRGNEFYELKYHFAVSRNSDSVRIGSSNRIISKKGWQYLWTRYAPKIDATAKARVMEPVASYVEDVYYTEDFSLLGIGL